MLLVAVAAEHVAILFFLLAPVARESGFELYIHADMNHEPFHAFVLAVA